MFKRFAVPAVAIAMAVIAGYTTPVFGHGNKSSAQSQQPGLRTVLAAPELPDQGTFVNYETPHVHPLDISPNGQWLAVVNTPDGYVEIFYIVQSGGNAGEIQHSDSIKVGVDPVSARWRSDNELWVVNHISDTISVVDRPSGSVTKTLVTYRLQDPGSGFLEGDPNGDEPADVVFNAGDTKAYVSCSRTDFIQVWDLATYALESEIYIDGEDPREMDIYNNKLYTAIFESGNGTTLLFGEEGVDSAAMPPNTAVLNLNQRTDHPYYFNGPGVGYEVYAIYPPPNTGQLAADFALNDFGSYSTPHGVVDIVELNNADLTRYEGINGAGSWDMLNSERYYFPPPTSIIVRRDYGVADFDPGAWVDENGGDWTAWISGVDVDKDGIYDVGDGDVNYTSESGRVFGWDLMDNDIAILDLTTDITNPSNHAYAVEQMNMCMALAVKKNGGNAGRVYMVGTEATNEVRFEANLTGTFVRVMLSITEADGTPVDLIDLNEEHLDTAQGGAGLAYQDGNVSQTDRNKSIGDPRGLAFTPDGATLYISGLGSNNVIALDTSTNERYSSGHTIEVGAGPTGLQHHSTLDRLYVVNKFEASVSVINTSTAGAEAVVQTLAFHDSTPDFINTGRVHFYGTHENSGLGQLACASCHIDGRMDKLAWDLGAPEALVDENDDIESPADANFTDIRGRGDGLLIGNDPVQTLDAPGSVIMNTMVFQGGSGTSSEAGFEKFHPMKGPMTTQTLQDIIGKEPHHWRGDKRGIEQFAGAFDGLQGDDVPLNSTSMQEFEDFLSSIHFPPNPFRPMDNTLAGGPNADGGTNGNLDMTGFYTAPPPGNANLSASGTPMMTAVPTGGDAWNGFKVYVDVKGDNVFRCVDCHTLPIGAGSIAAMPDFELPFTQTVANIPPGTEGEAHQLSVALDGTGQPHIKIPQTRNQYDKEGFYLNQMANGNGPGDSRAGFGVLHDGAIDGIVRFLSEPAFDNINDTGNNQPTGSNASTDDEMVADIVAFTLSLGGADFDYLTTLTGAPTGFIPPAAEDQSAHAGVGYSITIDATPAGSSDEEDLIYSMTRRANDGDLGLLVYGGKDGERRAWIHSSGEDGSTVFQSDREGETIAISSLLALPGSGTEMTFVMVEPVSEERVGLDRDQDTVMDGDEHGWGTDSANELDHVWVSDGWGGAQTGNPATPFEDFDPAVAGAVASPGKGIGLHFNGGTYSTTTSVFSDTMVLVGDNGTATISYTGP